MGNSVTLNVVASMLMHLGYLFLRGSNILLIFATFLGVVGVVWFFGFVFLLVGGNMAPMFSSMVLLLFICFAYLFLYIFKE